MRTLPLPAVTRPATVQGITVRQGIIGCQGIIGRLFQGEIAQMVQLSLPKDESPFPYLSSLGWKTTHSLDSLVLSLQSVNLVTIEIHIVALT